VTDRPDEDDLLYGFPAIAEFLKISTRQAEHLRDKHNLPTFNVGRIVCARPAALRTWLREREASGGQQ
jgi:hypothetical protein